MPVDSSLLVAGAAVAGSLVGAIASLGTSIVNQRLQSRRERTAAELIESRELYGRFIEEAAGLFLHSLGETRVDPVRMTRLFSIVARIRLTSTERVLRAAERVSRNLLDSYERPPVEASEFVAAGVRDQNGLDPLNEFTEECRRERLHILARL
jgi:hypothetical protein